MLLSTMQDHPLTITDLFRHGRAVHAGSQVVTSAGERTHRARFGKVAERVARLAAALHRLGIRAGDRVATFGWNTQAHLEAYFAVPCMGAVLHTLNIRLFPEQLAYVANHAEDRVILVDDSTVPLLARVRDHLRTVEHVVVVGSGDAAELGPSVLRYEDLLAADDEMRWRAKTGRAIAGVELRLVDADDQPIAWDGASAGEIEVRGPWITASYYRDSSPDKFDDGWLRTGDVGTVDAHGFVQITDRAKDVIKSGGEWISSVELENELMAHPAVAEAAVVGVPDERWQERPLACVVIKAGAAVTPDALRAFLAEGALEVVETDG